MDIFRFLRFLYAQTLAYEKDIGLQYDPTGNERLWMNLSLVVQRFSKSYPKISQSRANEIAVYASAIGLLETRENIGTIEPGEPSFDVTLTQAGHRFIDVDFGFVPSRLVLAWYAEDGKVVIVAFTAIIGLLTAILAILIKLVSLIASIAQ